MKFPKLNTRYLIITLVILVLSIYVMYWICIDSSLNQEDRGEFGDKFGAVSALFSGLAFAGIIASLYTQREALKVQENEIRSTQTQMRLQGFENFFFLLIKLLKDDVKEHKFNQSTDQNWDSFAKHTEEVFYKNIDSLENLRRYQKDETGQIQDIRSSCLTVIFHTGTLLKFIEKEKMNKKESNQYVQIMYNVLPAKFKYILIYIILADDFNDCFRPLNISGRLSAFINTMDSDCSCKVEEQLHELLEQYRLEYK